VTTIDKEYYARRLGEERTRQQQARSPAAAQAHAELAERYARLLREHDDTART
jgi:hypothetical protein